MANETAVEQSKQEHGRNIDTLIDEAKADLLLWASSHPARSDASGPVEILDSARRQLALALAILESPVAEAYYGPKRARAAADGVASMASGIALIRDHLADTDGPDGGHRVQRVA